MFAFVLAFLVLCLLGSDPAHAGRFPLEVRTTPCHQQPCPRQSSRLHSRAKTSIAITSDQNAEYLVNITVGGSQFTVVVDTGSSDLWLTGNVPNAHDLGKSATVTYAMGQASGPIKAADVSFAGNSIKDQAFIYVADSQSTGIDLSRMSGVMGLGPSSLSNVRVTVGAPSGYTFLDNTFRQDPSTPNFLSFLLGRAGGPTATSKVQGGGDLTIGDIVPGFENITNQPHVPIQRLVLKSDQHWTCLIDGITGPDGMPILLDSVVPDTPPNKLVAMVDSGFTLPQVPRSVSDSIYGRIQGATFDTSQGWWTAPCDQEVNITITIGGQPYVVHPLDALMSELSNTPDPKICIGSFQPITSAMDGTLDMILGMAFLRNAYTSINFGDFVDGDVNKQQDAYIQFLSITNPSDAHKDFVKQRLNGVDTTGDGQHSLLPGTSGQHSPQSTNEKAKNAFYRYWPWLAAGVGVFVVVGLATLLYRCCFLRYPTYPKQASGGYFIRSPYRPLHENNSASPMYLHTIGQPRDPYSNPYYHHA